MPNFERPTDEWVDEALRDKGCSCPWHVTRAGGYIAGEDLAVIGYQMMICIHHEDTCPLALTAQFLAPPAPDPHPMYVDPDAQEGC